MLFGFLLTSSVAKKGQNSFVRKGVRLYSNLKVQVNTWTPLSEKVPQALVEEL